MNVEAPAGIAAVVLAGGEGRRMGGPKGLVPFGAELLLTAQLRRLRTAGVDLVRVVVGDNQPAYLSVLPEMEPCLVADPRCRFGPFGSLCAGIAQLTQLPWQRLLMLPIDVPCASPAVVAQLAASSAEATVPRHGGHGGHPVVLSRLLAESLLELDPATTRLDHVLRGLPPGARRDIEVEDPDVIADLNTRAAVSEYEAKRDAR